MTDMKKMLFTFAMFCLSAVAMAQYEPNTKWPYIYENFTEGTAYSSDNTKSTLQMNVHLAGNVLHYIGKDDRIYRADDSKITRVEIGSDAYLFINHQLMQLIATNGTNVLVKLADPDFSRMQSAGGGAYGSDSNTLATSRKSSLELGGLNTPELAKMLLEKDDGAEIPIVVRYFLIIGDQRIEASKGAVEKYLGESREKEFKSFIKSNKIKWKSEESLKKILDFLSK